MPTRRDGDGVVFVSGAIRDDLDRGDPAASPFGRAAEQGSVLLHVRELHSSIERRLAAVVAANGATRLRRPHAAALEPLRARFPPFEVQYPALARWITRVGSLPGISRTSPAHSC